MLKPFFSYIPSNSNVGSHVDFVNVVEATCYEVGVIDLVMQWKLASLIGHILYITCVPQSLRRRKLLANVS